MTAAQDAPKLRLIRGRGTSEDGEVPGLLDALGDAELVALLRAGNRRAFEILYRRHAGFVANLTVRIQGGAWDVEDVVHDAFERAYARLSELREADAFRSWLASIAVRIVRTRLRKRRLLAVLGLSTSDPVDLDAIAAPDADVEARVLLAQVYALLQTLPADDRIAWTLRHIERRKLEDVAALTRCSLATVKRRILRGQRFLDAHFVAPFTVERSAKGGRRDREEAP